MKALWYNLIYRTKQERNFINVSKICKKRRPLYRTVIKDILTRSQKILTRMLVVLQKTEETVRPMYEYIYPVWAGASEHRI